MKPKKLKINSNFISGFKEGDVVDIQVDSDDTPIDPFWRKRLKDAQVDKCCEFVEVKKLKKEVKTNDDSSS